MENTELKKLPQNDSIEKSSQKKPRRRRSVTTLKMEWLAERVRKCRRIEQQIKDGTYRVDSREVAKAILAPKV